MMRLFLALVPPPVICQQLLLAMGGLPGARWQNEAQLHVTIRFIGETDRHVADALVLALSRDRLPAISARLDGFGHFERRGRIDQLWAGLAPREPLAALQTRLDRLCVAWGMEPEGRRFVPHITLARFTRTHAPDVHRLASWLSDQPPMTSAAFSFDRLLLIESILGAEGSSYAPVAEIGMRD
ncbi:RNA 2',3'-cyclic phosphodiesterase [Blastomonas sp.]|uniref:RNA 2',3'-cyclic phosphodiesterase n=1 Tax=Blastomonas sp. TaxID=1909299 RepID=UPI0035933F33